MSFHYVQAQMSSVQSCACASRCVKCFSYDRLITQPTGESYVKGPPSMQKPKEGRAESTTIRSTFWRLGCLVLIIFCRSTILPAVHSISSRDSFQEKLVLCRAVAIFILCFIESQCCTQLKRIQSLSFTMELFSPPYFYSFQLELQFVKSFF